MATTDFGFDTGSDFGFDLPSTDETPASFTVNEDHTVVPTSRDDFWGNAFDEEAIAASLEEDLVPEGEHTLTLGGVHQRANRFEGYPEVRYFQKITVDGNSAYVTLTITPLKVMKIDGSGKVRYEHVLFKQVRELYKTINGQYPASGEEFNAFVTSTELVYRTVRDRNGKDLKVMSVRKPAN